MATKALTTEEGYSGKRAAEIAGITYRQLDYWARTDLVMPSLARATGSGSRRLYSYRDLLELRAVKSLLDAGIRLQTVQTLDPSTKPLTKPVDVPLEELGFNPSQAPPADRLTDLDVLVKSIDKEGLLQPPQKQHRSQDPPEYYAVL